MFSWLYLLLCWSLCLNIKKAYSLLSCPTLCDPMDYNLPGFSVHGIFQARILEWVAVPISRGSSQPRDRTRVSHIVGRFFTIWVIIDNYYINKNPFLKSVKWTGSLWPALSHHSLSWGMHVCVHIHTHSYLCTKRFPLLLPIFWLFMFSLRLRAIGKHST